MNAPNPSMTKQLKNLFPEAFKKGVSEIFGEQAMYPVLLGLLSAGGVSAQHQPDPCPADILHPNEAAILGGYTFPKRRSEYLTGRACAKMAVQGFLNLNDAQPAPVLMPEIEIAGKVGGRPIVRLHTAKAGPEMDISISHSGEYGVALVAGLQCGIDLQEQKGALLKVQEKYCSRDEFILLEKILPGQAALTRLAILWAAKEAAKKALSDRQMYGFLDLELRRLKTLPHYSALSLHLSHAKNQQLPEKVTVAAGMFAGYALAICLVNEEHNAGTARS